MYNIYYSFVEFKENYQFNLEKWQNIYPNGSEKEYLDEVKKAYTFYILDPQHIEVEEYDFEKKTFIPSVINFYLLGQIFKARIDRLENLHGEEFDYKGYLEENFLNIYGRSDLGSESPKFADNYAIGLNTFKWISFFENGGGGLDEIGGTDLVFDPDKFQDFQFVKKRVSEFVEKRLHEIDNGINLEDATGNIKKSDVIATLHATGIIDFLKQKYPNASQRGLARYIEYITNGFIKASSFNSQFTTDKENAKAPKHLKPEISEFLQSCFKTDRNAF